MGEKNEQTKMMFSTREFRISRLKMAYLSAEEYIRHFWWYVAIVPVFGIMALFTGNDSFKLAGFVAILWPLSIPARAILTTTRSAALFDKGAWVGVTKDAILVHGHEKKGLKLDLDAIRDTVCRQGYLLVRTKRLGFLPIPESAFYQPSDVQHFRDWLVKQLDVD